MNDAQREASGSGLGPNGEDLDLVLRRFKEWSETYRSRPGVNSGVGAGSGRSLGDAREVTYEEALRASSYRRAADLTAIDPSPLELDDESAIRVEAESNDPHLTETLLRAALSQNTPPVAQTHRLEPRFVSTAEAIATGAPRPETPGAAAQDSRPVAQNMVESRPLEDGLRLRAKIGVVQAQYAAPPDAQAVQAASQTEAFPKPKASPRKQPLSQPAFRDVLKGTAALVAAAQPGGAILERGKSNSLTLRVSDSEQARIQACAAQANLSVSAYLRQCALGVDDLRNQVDLALSTLHEQQARSAPPPGLSAIPGILGRCAMQCFRRLRRSSDDYTVFSLR